jgi:hypothetical protein
MAGAGEAAGTVEQMPWARLRPRITEPACVLEAIPPEDVHSFLRLLARNPMLPFPDASVVQKSILTLRNARVASARQTLAYVAGCSLQAVCAASMRSARRRLTVLFLSPSALCPTGASVDRSTA